jgi:hypothetical protein
MAKITGSIIGNLTGKAGDCVFGKWKDGIHWMKVRAIPTQRGTVADNEKYLKGTIRRMSYTQMNVRNVIRVLGNIGRKNLQTWIDLIWEDYNTRHNVKHLTGLNQMVKSNMSRLFNSITTKTAIWNEATNKIDLTLLLASKGDLEAPVAITSAVYTVLTGDLTILFASQHYTNGSDSDLAYAMVTKKPILDTEDWEPKLFVYPPSRGNSKTRADGTISLVLPAGLTKTDLVAYLFFKDAAGTLGFSDSLAIQVS